MATFYFRPNPDRSSRLKVAQRLLNFEIDFPARLKDLRISLGLSSENLAKALEVAPALCAGWENGRYLETIPLEKLANFLGIGMEELIIGHDSSVALLDEITHRLRTIAEELERIRKSVDNSFEGVSRPVRAELVTDHSLVSNAQA